jgi:DNA (cytosine-5)-methyltransferase 1
VTARSLTIGSLFSGIGGLELGLERAGLGPVLWQCEIDPFCRAVLAKHWPNVTRFDDVTQPRSYPHADLICGGFPCQDVSDAGEQRGLQGARSGLWFHFARVVAQVRPSWVVVENVALGAVRRWLPTVRRHLCELGYGTRPFQLSAAEVGATHLRRRVFVVAHADRTRLEGALVGPKQSRGQEPAQRHGWPSRSDVGAVVHGVSGGLAGRGRRSRIRALGNAVVPQQAEAIGRVILQMMSDVRRTANDPPKEGT